MGASFGGIAGGMFAAIQGFISPESFVLVESIMVLSSCLVRDTSSAGAWGPADEEPDFGSNMRQGAWARYLLNRGGNLNFRSCYAQTHGYVPAAGQNFVPPAICCHHTPTEIWVSSASGYGPLRMSVECHGCFLRESKGDDFHG